MLPTIENVIKVDIRQLMYGNIIDNTLYFKGGEGITPVDFTDIQTFVDEVLYDQLVATSAWHDRRINEWCTLQISALSLGTVPILYELTAGLPIFGGSASTTSNQQALVTTFYSSLDSRSGRGRNFWGGIANVNLSNGLWDASTLSAVKGVYDNLLFAVSETDWIWGVLSYYEDSAVRETPLFSEVTHVTPRAIPASFATRRIGRGS